ncbi:VOC family protein [Ottowia testudinis]|uniref:VOC family protein n=1 Tax=Ottowia testudinis TaxID=2816950 RepID=A0A975CDK5_9BURK|nr:VOC family protein [Ottowia testudinis]QTD44498.1 VOC family protein [Ottowia testudinis]
MQFVPYLNFNGNCAEAFAFYKDVFKGTLVHQSTYGEMPEGPPIPPEARQHIMHVHLQVGEQALMGSDAMPGATDVCAGGYAKPQGLWVSIGVASADEGRRVFDALAPGGQVAMPFDKTFWSPGFGMVTDRFGTPWMVNVATP